MAETIFSEGDTVWFWDCSEQLLKPAVIEERHDGDWSIPPWYRVMVAGGETNMLAGTLFRNPEEFVRKVESQEYEIQLELLQMEYDNAF